MAKVESKDPRALLREMMDLISVELASLRAQANEPGLEDREGYSKQLQRLITSIRGTIKDTAAVLEEEKAEAEGLSDVDIAAALVADPVQRAVLAHAFKTIGWTVEEPAPFTEPAKGRKIDMGARAKRKTRKAAAGSLLETMGLTPPTEDPHDV